jgi:septal ring factor EnvC (AmiA/AmiB activator)
MSRSSDLTLKAMDVLSKALEESKAENIALKKKTTHLRAELECLRAQSKELTEKIAKAEAILAELNNNAEATPHKAKPDFATPQPPPKRRREASPSGRPAKSRKDLDL